MDNDNVNWLTQNDNPTIQVYLMIRRSTSRSQVAFLLALVSLVFAHEARAQEDRDPSNKAEKVVAAYEAVFNNHDLEGFSSVLAEDVRFYIFPDREVNRGLDNVRQQYAAMFNASPNMRAKVTSRIARGNIAVEYKRIENAPRPDGSMGSMETIFLYEVVNDRITRVWFVQP